MSSPSTNTQSPFKSKKVVEFSEQREESIETTGKHKKWFYIGMTGDPHYPSARSAFYRLVGHLELNIRSTQNQLQIAMKAKTSEPGFMGLNDYSDSNTEKSYESANHKNHSSDNY